MTECPACGHGVEWHGSITGCDHMRNSILLPTTISQWTDQTVKYECGCRYQDTAVCDACGWEGTEAGIAQPGDGVTADTCPRCNQNAVNYFFPGGYE
jgi:hypothetical protein